MGRAKQAGNKFLLNVIEEEQEFKFRPYVFTPRGRTATFHLFDLHNYEIVHSTRDALAPLALVMMAIMALTLLPSKLSKARIGSQ